MIDGQSFVCAVIAVVFVRACVVLAKGLLDLIGECDETGGPDHEIVFLFVVGPGRYARPDQPEPPIQGPLALPSDGGSRDRECVPP